MDKLLMIADDLTGALDAGVAFASAGIPTCVGQGTYFTDDPDAADCGVQVTVVPTRHMARGEAYRAVYGVVEKAMALDFTCIYKKTDSALRGNVGAELEAVLAASGEQTLYFVPALPKMNRVTRDGVQYIDGNIPVAQSVFGADPFDPVRHSRVTEVIAETSPVSAYSAEADWENYLEGVAVFDAETDADVQRAAFHIFHTAKAKLVAGCAGLAAALPEVLELKRTAREPVRLSGKLLVFCGSVNPISLRQCAEAESQGAPRFHLIRDGGFAEEDQLISQTARASADNPVTVVDTGSDKVDTRIMDAAESGRYIAARMGRVIRGVRERVPDATLFVIGGDTLIAYMNCLGIETIIPVEELFPGVVLAKYRFEGEWRYLISKSGGFGAPELLKQISLKLSSPGAKAANGGV